MKVLKIAYAHLEPTHRHRHGSIQFVRVEDDEVGQLQKPKVTRSSWAKLLGNDVWVLFVL